MTEESLVELLEETQPEATPETVEKAKPQPAKPKAKEQAVVFPQLEPLLKDIQQWLTTINNRLWRIETLLKDKVDLDTLEGKVMDLLIKRMEK